MNDVVNNFFIAEVLCMALLSFLFVPTVIAEVAQCFAMIVVSMKFAEFSTKQIAIT